MNAQKIADQVGSFGNNGVAAPGGGPDPIENFRAYLAQYLGQRGVEARYSGDLRSPGQWRLVLSATDLGTARPEGNPLKIDFPFTGFHVEDATDATVSVRLSQNAADGFSIANYKSIKLNDAGTFNRVQKNAQITWAAQTGKAITIVFFFDTEFRPGSQLSLTSGGVAVTEGSAITHALVTLTAATAVVVFAADSTRKLGTFRNTTGARIWVGLSTITSGDAAAATDGFIVEPGDVFEYRNTAALYALSVGGGAVVAVTQS